MNTEPLETNKGPFIVTVAPNYSCCHCRNRLQRGFVGLCTRIRSIQYPFVFVVCASCQSSGLMALRSGGCDAAVFSHAVLRALLDDMDRIAGFAQISRLGSVTLFEPYPIQRR